MPLCKRLHRGKEETEKEGHDKVRGREEVEGKERIFFQTGNLCFSVAEKTSSDIFTQLRASVKTNSVAAKSN